MWCLKSGRSWSPWRHCYAHALFWPLLAHRTLHNVASQATNTQGRYRCTGHSLRSTRQLSCWRCKHRSPCERIRRPSVFLRVSNHASIQYRCRPFRAASREVSLGPRRGHLRCHQWCGTWSRSIQLLFWPWSAPKWGCARRRDLHSQGKPRSLLESRRTLRPPRLPT